MLGDHSSYVKEFGKPGFWGSLLFLISAMFVHPGLQNGSIAIALMYAALFLVPFSIACGLLTTLKPYSFLAQAFLVIPYAVVVPCGAIWAGMSFGANLWGLDVQPAEWSEFLQRLILISVVGIVLAMFGVTVLEAIRRKG